MVSIRQPWLPPPAAAPAPLLGGAGRAAAWARFRTSEPLRPGEPVVATGFPLAGLLSPEMAVTTGSVTALGGGRGDPRQFQFSAPVQPGNSGAPSLDASGRVIGVATAEPNGAMPAVLGGQCHRTSTSPSKATSRPAFSPPTASRPA